MSIPQNVAPRVRQLTSLLCATTLTAIGVTACKNDAPVPPPAAPAAANFHLAASVQELMHNLVDPSADGVWDVVGSTLTAKGAQDRQPRTEEEWRQVRAHAILLIEATNLLAMDGRRLVPVGGKVTDEGNEGVLTAVEGQKQLDEQHAAFVQFALALREASIRMLAAVDAKDPRAMFDIGSDLDTVCEACHTTFWYPHQVYPNPQNGITTLEAARPGK